ncbi:E3 ubiquitin-protein ligase RBBP6-like [Athene noctua]|uniref:E3 ubiquitin-protein ligase RBBP6-like n=1 Tax=Athene noctua TaxID=126797 RepID=UPI003EB7C799
MPCVHFQSFSQLRRDTVTFSGLHISLGDLKRKIMGRQKLKAANCDLRVSNAETREEYTDDSALMPKNSSVIVRRVPARGVKTTSKTQVITRTEPASGTSKAVCKNTISHFFFYTLHLILNNVASY